MSLYGTMDKKTIYFMAYRIVKCLWEERPEEYQKNAFYQICETAATETQFSTYRDPSWEAGMGLCQFDKMPFYDIKNRAFQKDKRKIREEFDIAVEKVEWEDLRFSPGLSLVFCALFYRLVPESFSEKREKRGELWKKRYNTVLGKGTVEHFLETCDKLIMEKAWEWVAKESEEK